MSTNNGTPHNTKEQQFLSDFSHCTFYFFSEANENRLKGIYQEKEFVAFCLAEKEHCVDIYVSIPDKYKCVHYKKGAITSSVISRKAHLTYHGTQKRKKISGEIHIVTDQMNPLKGKSKYTEAPLASSSNIQIHPLPVCRIEISSNPGELEQPSKAVNYFYANTTGCFFNTIEVHLARKGYMRDLASVSQNIPAAWASVFMHTSMHTYFLGKLERRPGHFPQALCLQTRRFELIVLATHEYKNTSYTENGVKYFYTKDYFRDLGSRNVIEHADGWFIDQLPDGTKRPDSKRLSDLLTPSRPA